MWVPGYRPNRRMDMVQRRSHHSPRSWISVSYCTTTVCGHTCSWTTCGRQQCHCPVASNHCPKECEARAPHTHFSSPSSLMVVLGSSVPILHQNLACTPRYPLKKREMLQMSSRTGGPPHLDILIFLVGSTTIYI